MTQYLGLTLPDGRKLHVAEGFAFHADKFAVGWTVPRFGIQEPAETHDGCCVFVGGCKVHVKETEAEILHLLGLR